MANLYRNVIWFLPLIAILGVIGLRRMDYYSQVESHLVAAAETPHPYLAVKHLDQAFEGLELLKLRCEAPKPHPCTTSVWIGDANNEVGTWYWSLLLTKRIAILAKETSNLESVLAMQRVREGLVDGNGHIKSPSRLYLYPHSHHLTFGILLCSLVALMGAFFMVREVHKS